MYQIVSEPLATLLLTATMIINESNKGPSGLRHGMGMEGMDNAIIVADNSFHGLLSGLVWIGSVGVGSSFWRISVIFPPL